MRRMASHFRQTFFPDATARDWRDWHWQLRNAFRSQAQLERVLTLAPEEREAFANGTRTFPVSVTPYYLGLIDPTDPADPLRLTMIPRAAEHVEGPGESWDPLGEESHSPAPRIVHTYPGKVLFLVTDHCATYCRFCTRARVVGSGRLRTDSAEWDAGLQYIAGHPAIRDVLLSGGDPLIFSDGRLDDLLERLRAIPHVEIIRVGTKIPAVLPQRITPDLARVLKSHAPLWISAHFTHPRELTPEAEVACNRLAHAGVPVVSQTVLLKDVNDDADMLKTLFERLLRLRVRPYYLHQCDPIVGSAHFRTSVETGQRLIESLQGRTTGFAIPSLMIDASGGGGKVPVGPQYLTGRDGDDLLLRNYEGNTYRYHDPV